VLGRGDVSPTPAHFAARIDFLKDEVFEICGALALGESLLSHLGRHNEAAHLAAVFDVVEGRLVAPVRTTAGAYEGGVPSSSGS
jgi:hypothetical protein